MAMAMRWFYTTLLQKPLDATIRQLLAPYHPSGCQGNSKENNNNKLSNFAFHFAGHGNAPVPYHLYRPMEDVEDFTRSHWMLPSGEYCGQ
jgi:hypothetical protein